MLSVADALHKVLNAAVQGQPVRVPLANSLGRVLAVDVSSDIDMPPYDKSLVDGYAVRAGDLQSGRAELKVVAEVFAGQVPDRDLEQGESIRIMTGAPIPVGCDAVVMVERTRVVNEPAEVVSIDDTTFRPSQHILRRATEMRAGQLVMSAGTRIRPAEVGLLASVGQSNVTVSQQPEVAIISTGDEIVEPHESPAPGQIRNSNGATTLALSLAAGATPRYLGIASDHPDVLRQYISKGLKSDVLVLSGGVSAGKLDLVPDILRAHGVEQVFHKVDLKPGRPMWFGVCREEGRNCLVFGLPGNPVSVIVCFELFVVPVLERMMGRKCDGPTIIRVQHCGKHSQKASRRTYWPCRIRVLDGIVSAKPVEWKGSPDLRAMTEADGFIVYPEVGHYRDGDIVEVFLTVSGRSRLDSTILGKDEESDE